MTVPSCLKVHWVHDLSSQPPCSTGKFPLKYVGTDGDLQMRFFYLLKERLFPFVYWNLWTRGMWYGTNGPFKPNVAGGQNTDSQQILGKISKK